jgi:hypothetical protein
VSAPLRFRGTLAPQRRGWLGVVLPAESMEFLGTRGQAPVEASVNGLAFRTTAFPTGDGRHVVCVGARIRRRLGIREGVSVDVEVTRARPRASPRTPPELREALAASDEARRAWDGLTPAARRVASTWIAGAKDPDVRSWRVADVVRRALRHARGEGPFYPTKEDQRLLARPRSG